MANVRNTNNVDVPYAVILDTPGKLYTLWLRRTRGCNIIRITVLDNPYAVFLDACSWRSDIPRGELALCLCYCGNLDDNSRNVLLRTSAMWTLNTATRKQCDSISLNNLQDFNCCPIVDEHIETFKNSSLLIDHYQFSARPVQRRRSALRRN